LGSLARWTIEVVYSLGYPGVAALVVLSNLQVPLPSELVLPLSGHLVGQGRFSFVPLLIWTTAGAVAASLIPYVPGRWLGEERVLRFLRRFGRFALVYESDLDKASGWFERHGGEAVLIGRLVPGVGSLISVPAGIKRMPLWRFVLYSTLSSAIWNGTFIGLGWWLGARWGLAGHYERVALYAVLAAVGGGVLWLVWRRLSTRS
jgi:membrane protein DedA with SNARE-associated domain